ncbi:MAG: hypothetical protein MJ108_09575 [Saccharofermentans sp.]|nr:hypothetical protein [Saccharofermentans sp.]
MEIHKVNITTDLSESELLELEEAKKREIVYDDDSPALTPEMEKAFILAAKSRDRLLDSKKIS